MEQSNITVFTSHSGIYKPGDIIQVFGPEDRWWMLLWYFLTCRKPRQRVTAEYKVASVSVTTLQTERKK